MTEYVFQATKNVAAYLGLSNRHFKRILIFSLIFLLSLIPGDLGAISRAAIADAYLQVTIFVALTLILIYGLEYIFRFDLGEFNTRHPNLQVGISSFLGALPGCGGAIMVLTQYVRNKVSFGSIIAALTATMGDAAFVLLAAEPDTAGAIILMALIVGAITGTIVDSIHGRDFLKVKHGTRALNKYIKDHHHSHVKINASVKPVWWAILLPGSALGIAGAMQIDTNLWFLELTNLPITTYIGYFGALVAMSLWVFDSNDVDDLCQNNHSYEGFSNRVLTDSNFVTVWVIMAFLVYEVSVHAFNIDLKQLFNNALPLLPIIAILVGFIPGCGPQIIVTTLYINGIIPLSAQLGNSISNDGDALFPAIAIAPKAAILATLYSAIPAVLIAYGWFLFME